MKDLRWIEIETEDVKCGLGLGPVDEIEMAGAGLVLLLFYWTVSIGLIRNPVQIIIPLLFFILH